MMEKKLLLVLVLFIACTVFAQDKNKISESCGSEEINQKLMAQNPKIVEKLIQFEKVIKQKKITSKTAASVYIIPIVIHVMHKGEPIGQGTNITDNEIKAKIKAINEEFRKVANTQGDGAGVDIGIEFALAVVDPSGKPTNGIVRYDMSACSSSDCIAYMNNGVNNATTGGISDLALKTLSNWDSSTYYNFWLVSEIDNNNGGAGIQGFATFPGFHGQVVDGTIVMANTFKRLTMTVETHELGHAFNLQHTFKGEVINGSVHTCPPSDPTLGDFCADTAPHTSDIVDCSAPGTNSCDTGIGGTGSYSRFINNYMSYSYDSCRNMFTQDQKDRIIATLIGPRKSFLSVEAQNHLIPVATPICDFSPSGPTLIITGENIDFVDTSLNVPNTYISNANGVSSSWQVSDGKTTLVSSSQNPNFTFSVPGNYNVSLTSGNLIGSNSKSISNAVLVTDPAILSSIPRSTNVGAFGSTVYKVTLKDISNTTDFFKNQNPSDLTAYSDFTTKYKTIVNPGETCQLGVILNASASASEYFAAYIDYNNDGAYTADEIIANGSMPNLSPDTNCPDLTACTITTTFNIPASATKNKLLRMRIIGSRSAVTLANMNGTSAMTVGDIEDYGVYVLGIDPSPSIIYNSPNVFTLGTAITNLTPANTGGAATSYSVSPALPSGLILNASTGVISGTPSQVTAQSTYGVTATNSAGNSVFPLVITVKTNVVVPSITYSSPNVFTLGTAITNLTPANTGGAATSYSVSPALPSGLILNGSTGVISGTPSQVTAQSTYGVTATNSAGNSVFPLVITVKTNVVVPSITYSSPNVFTLGTAITNLTPANTGGAATSYSVSPALPSGLILNASTGVISGTPSQVTAQSTYGVTATNSAGNSVFPLVITVKTNVVVPSIIYNSPNVFTLGTAITNLTPANTGGAATSYSVSPALPSGLILNASTGVISGTPSQVTAQSTYGVTATNSAGNSVFPLVITIKTNVVVPSIIYNSPNVFTLGTAITNLTPANTGGAATSYSVSPALPSGLILNASTGVISGTPSQVTAQSTYGVTATNSAGNSVFPLVITIKTNVVVPSIIYNSPNVFTVGTAITNLTPANTGGAATSYSVSPALPSGLILNASTGVISGTPSQVTAQSTYSVTATNSAGNSVIPLVITVKTNVVVPSITYSSPSVFTLGTAITNLTPANTGGAATSYSVSPALPSGLILNASTGVISGTPSQVTAQSTYSVTTTNSAGNSVFPLVITVKTNVVSPSITYNSQNVFVVGTTIGNLIPLNTGGKVVNYTISPVLPNGLNFSETSGIISGLPSEAKEETIYTITATNNGGSSAYEIKISISPALGLKDPTLSKIRIYPNPVQDILNIDGKEGIKSVEVYNMLGQLVHSQQYNDFDTAGFLKLVDFSSLKTGIYLIVIFTDSEKSSYKILKK